MLYKVDLTFESVDEILKCDRSNESYWAAFPLYNVYYAVQGGSNFWVCGWSPLGWPFKWKLQSYFPAVLFITPCKVVLTFESGNQIMKYYYWKKKTLVPRVGCMVPPFYRMYELWYKKASEQNFSKAHSVFIRAPLQDGSIRLTS